MIETINGKAYLKVGDKVYELGGGGSNIITADSVEQLPDPASVPEGTIALVKGEGESGGGLPVVKLETVPTTDGAVLSENDTAKINALGTNTNFILKCTMSDGVPLSVVTSGFSLATDEFTIFLAAGCFKISPTNELLVWVDNSSAGTGEFVIATNYVPG